MSTARRGPDFFIIGAMKSGTTALYAYLRQHPDILPPSRKEVHYYDREIHRGWTLETYLDQFPERDAHQLSFDSTPNTMRLRDGASQVHADFPDLKLIAILRDPVQRAHSHYNQRAIKQKDRRSLDEAMAENLAISKGEYASDQARSPDEFADETLSYLGRGRYAEQLEPWIKAFGRSQMKVLFSDALRNQGQETMAELMQFLGLSAHTFKLDLAVNTRSYAAMSDITQDQLRAYYEPHDLALEKLLGRPLPWRS